MDGLKTIICYYRKIVALPKMSTIINLKKEKLNCYVLLTKISSMLFKAFNFGCLKCIFHLSHKLFLCLLWLTHKIISTKLYRY